jgi:hypothetical protein
LSTYAALLIWNYVQAPARDLKAEPDSAQFARVHVPFTVRRKVWLLAMPLIASSKLSANAFVEALIARDLRSGEAGLTILPARGGARPRLG